MQPRDYEAMGRWVYDTCRLFGASPETSHEVAAIFVRSVKEDHARQDRERGA